MHHRHSSSGLLTPAESRRYHNGDQCPACGMTVGTDDYWYVDREEAPGYPWPEDEEDMRRTVRLWWDTQDPTNPGWAYTVTQHGPEGWADVDSGGLSEATLNCDTEAELIACFRREYPAYAGDTITVE